MKKLLTGFFLVAVGYSTGFSQNGRSEFTLIKSIFGTEKTNYIKEQMNLTDSEELIFWPIYEDYEIARAKFSGKQYDMLQKYAAQYHSLSGSQAKEYVNDLLRYQRKGIKLKNKYFNLMSNQLSPVKASQFIELEEYINFRVKYAILGELPFVQE